MSTSFFKIGGQAGTSVFSLKAKQKSDGLDAPALISSVAYRSILASVFVLTGLSLIALSYRRYQWTAGVFLAAVPSAVLWQCYEIRKIEKDLFLHKKGVVEISKSVENMIEKTLLVTSVSCAFAAALSLYAGFKGTRIIMKISVPMNRFGKIFVALVWKGSSQFYVFSKLLKCLQINGIFYRNYVPVCHLVSKFLATHDKDPWERLDGSLVFKRMREDFIRVSHDFSLEHLKNMGRGEQIQHLLMTISISEGSSEKVEQILSHPSAQLSLDLLKEHVPKSAYKDHILPFFKKKRSGR